MPLSCSITLSGDVSFVLALACNITKGRNFQVITCLSPSKMWAELSSFEFYIGPSCLGQSFGPCRVVLGRVLCGPSWFGPSCFRAEKSCTLLTECSCFIEFIRRVGEKR